ncbi:MAG: Rrf2 family transcriptional regulator [Armatimonadetes bacterium]|nr:Rrf2 family transcriptional regulator [Armatimonadota bacterium]
MLKMPAGAEYSLLAMAHLASAYSADERVKAAELAQAQGVPLSFLERLLAQLSAGGLVDSTRGPGGGHRLSRPPEATRVSEVLEAILGPSASHGPLAFLWDRCERALSEVLSLSLAELAEELDRERDVADYQI